MKHLYLAVACIGSLLGCTVGHAQPADAVALFQSDLEWVETAPGVAVAAVYGDWKEEAHGMFFRFDAGHATPLHIHTNHNHGVVIAGLVQNPYPEEDDPPELGPGDYWFVPAEAPHVTECIAEEPCTFYAHSNEGFDLVVVEE